MSCEGTDCTTDTEDSGDGETTVTTDDLQPQLSDIHTIPDDKSNSETHTYDTDTMQDFPGDTSEIIETNAVVADTDKAPQYIWKEMGFSQCSATCGVGMYM